MVIRHVNVGCASCRFAGQCGQKGNPGPDPMALTSQQLVALACALARVGAVICDVGHVGASAFGRPDLDRQPYIWDIKED